MNDKFKMRAWDENNKIMHYDFQFIKSGDNGNDWIIFQSDKQKLNFDKEKNFCINVYPNPYFAQQLKIMQSTGLKDKNDKLIYEGDIIKVGNGSINGSVIETTREVKWIINTWNVPVWVVDKPNFSHYVQVIGNIYENKELLNENS